MLQTAFELDKVKYSKHSVTRKIKFQRHNESLSNILNSQMILHLFLHLEKNQINFH